MKKKNINYDYTAAMYALDTENFGAVDYIEETCPSLMEYVPISMSEFDEIFSGFTPWEIAEVVSSDEFNIYDKYFTKKTDLSEAWFSLYDEDDVAVWLLGLIDDKEDYVNWLLKNGYITEAELYYKEA